MKQKDKLIDSLIKQAYRNATSSNDQHQQNVIAWLVRLQSSVRSPARSAPAAHPFHLDTRAIKVAGQSDDESDEKPASQERAQQPPPLVGLGRCTSVAQHPRRIQTMLFPSGSV
ncbi:hypothetical protein F5148DRAFT_272063 [Russula earlei]|uniref:Uncharacterized protein n=1 Tax=Russula earlei TaxID=71964 RepID=A0ACC0U3S7_9AGAM|nr:hypothetical protein F5148DRAFT_272063 [Russula earlei]